MQWDEGLHRDEVSRVVLEITNIDARHAMNVTSAGLYIDWMRLGTFETNTTSFLLEPGQRKAVDIFFRVPADARYGLHSDYMLIEYTIQNGTNGTWSRGTFESTINKDFGVVERPGLSRDWLALSFTNPLCIAGLVAAIIIAAVVAARRMRRMPGGILKPDEPLPGSPPELPSPPAPAGEKRPEGPEKCPFCGAPWPGKHCQNCGWDLG